MIMEPIRDMQKIKQMQTYLKGRNPRDFFLFQVGLNTGLRITDILHLQVYEFILPDGTFRDHLIVIEQKTGKTKRILINNSLRKCFIEHVKYYNLKYEDYLFQSRKGVNKPIQRVQAYRILKEAADALGIQNFGPHSMRKTWGYWTYKKSNHNIGLIMDMFNHSSEAVCLRYIGINQEAKDELYDLVQF